MAHPSVRGMTVDQRMVPIKALLDEAVKDIHQHSKLLVMVRAHLDAAEENGLEKGKEPAKLKQIENALYEGMGHVTHCYNKHAPTEHVKTELKEVIARIGSACNTIREMLK